MSRTRSTVTLQPPRGPDPLSCDEYAVRLGQVDGMVVLRYRSGGALEFGSSRQDFLHQLYWSPEGVLAAEHAGRTWHVGGREALWVRRAVTHDIRAYGRTDAYRICLREVPEQLVDLTYGPVELAQETIDQLLACVPGASEAVGLGARRSLMRATSPAAAGITIPPRGRGYAATVARHLAYDPGDPSGLADWASRLHVSGKTLQRDFHDTFGVPFTEWRTDQRLRLARTLLQSGTVTQVAEHVGYSSPSAFGYAFRRRFGYSPGQAGALARGPGDSSG